MFTLSKEDALTKKLKKRVTDNEEKRRKRDEMAKLLANEEAASNSAFLLFLVRNIRSPRNNFENICDPPHAHPPPPLSPSLSLSFAELEAARLQKKSEQTAAGRRPKGAPSAPLPLPGPSALGRDVIEVRGTQPR